MKKITKTILSVLGLTAVVATGLGIDVYRNVGDRPDGSQYTHLSYYKDGAFVADEELPYYPDKQIGQTSRIGRSPMPPNTDCLWKNYPPLLLVRPKILLIIGLDIRQRFWN